MPIDTDVLKVIEELTLKHHGDFFKIIREIPKIIIDPEKRPTNTHIANYLNAKKQGKDYDWPEKRKCYSAGSSPSRVGRKPQGEYKYT